MNEFRSNSFGPDLAPAALATEFSAQIHPKAGKGMDEVATRRLRVISASIFGVSVLILLAAILVLPHNVGAQEQSALLAVVLKTLAVLASIAAPACFLSAAGWVLSVVLDARRQASSDSILDWRFE
jgi:hypothetical protein